MAPVVLCVNHRERTCGVHQFFKRLTAPLLTSTKYAVYYIDPGEESEFDYWQNQLNPDIIFMNFYTGATMPWLSPDKVSQIKTRAKVCNIFHEVGISHMRFDLIFHQDPTSTETWAVALPRPIPQYTSLLTQGNTIPVIGSFGFGLGGKGFTRLAALVSQQFERAILRINIPYAHFGDIDGRGAHDWSRQIHACSFNPNIMLNITHDFMDEPQLLEWLAGNDMNCFLYDDNYGRGISGTTDYALAVKRPIAITRSDQFHHLWRIDDSFTVEQHTLPELLARGTAHLDKFLAMWRAEDLVQAFERNFDQLLGV